MLYFYIGTYPCVKRFLCLADLSFLSNIEKVGI